MRILRAAAFSGRQHCIDLRLVAPHFLHELAGVREGTLAAAVFVGLIAKQFNRFMVPFADRLFRPFAAKRDN